GCGDGHCLGAVLGFGKGNCCVSHALFVVSAPGRESIAGLLQRFTNPGDVAMAEDGPASRDQHISVAVLLCGQIADHRLCRRQSDCRHAASLSAAASAWSQRAQRSAYTPAISATAAASLMSPVSHFLAAA